MIGQRSPPSLISHLQNKMSATFRPCLICHTSESERLEASIFARRRFSRPSQSAEPLMRNVKFSCVLRPSQLLPNTLSLSSFWQFLPTNLSMFSFYRHLVCLVPFHLISDFHSLHLVPSLSVVQLHLLLEVQLCIFTFTLSNVLAWS